MILGIPITGETVAFFLLSLLIISSGVMVMSLTKVMHTALALGGVFLGVAGIFILLGADFVGVVQILIYAGAITILMVFALMLTQKGDDTGYPGPGKRSFFTLLGVAAFCALLLFVIRGTSWPVATTKVDPFPQPSIVMIAQSLFHTYTVPFELVTLILTAALVGAVVIARKEE
ncbi:NADH-quinone oxidoreductase subunit J [Ferroacidibacillus organovorans]|uniref:NADH-quinone oxidoreductase subunit J n=1 Tax=Ferroacidibacillus organovorans TaxID=1765683 RepID=A0A161QH09_9BACL|nr:NADH-quinone oxidoreductase subunit J [Ferroacidibacillus organovorans]KYP81470.1 hypothetical protein AYJ22_07565 [Ferroacidibacillus organovorans]OAG93986.1 hypothetical protein AYW79_07600 [Ferroacidibacillus organovorans]OPG16714.1 hypothetical protein B2M26_04960 [Ferroacidibacillus organovorans]